MAYLTSGAIATGHPGVPTGSGAISSLPARLSVMMLLEFVVFGSWFATLGLVLSTHHLDRIIANAYLLSAVAAIVSPLLLGAIGDRYLPPRTVLALSHLVGAALIVMLPSAIASANASLTLGLLFAYMLSFQPTLALVNSISLTALGPRQSVFPYIRVFAPLGWVVAGLGIGALGLSASTHVFYWAAGVSLALALYSVTLPSTAPAAHGARFSIGDVVGINAFVLFRERSFTVLMICALMTSISLGIYNSFASPYLAVLGISNVAGVLALGQISEVLFVVTIPWILARIGMKWALLCGMAMWGIRFLLFIAAAKGDQSFAVVGVALHGICNDCFIVVAAMYIARIAAPELASQAQSWLILVVSGFGQAIGSATAGTVYASAVVPNQAHGAPAWTPLWLIPIGLAMATALVWTTFFHPMRHAETVG